MPGLSGIPGALDTNPFGAGLASLTQGYVAAVLVATLVLLLVLRLRAELVALLVLIALEIPGVLTRDEALSGFSNSAVITIIGLFVLSAALERTGVADHMAGLIVRAGGASEQRLVAVVMLVAAALSLVMNNIAAGAVILPAVMTVARRVRVSPSKLLMPVAFGAGLGGMATIFTTANILISNTLLAAGHQRLGFLDFLPIGSVLIAAGTLYMMLAGRRLLRAADPLAEAGSGPALHEAYDLGERLWEAELSPGSPLAGQTLAASQLGTRYGVAVIGILRGQSADLAPGPEAVPQPGDVLLVTGREDAVADLPGVVLGRYTPSVRSAGSSGVRGPAPRSARTSSRPQVELAEVVVAPRADFLGQSLKELEFRRRFGVTVVAVWQAGRAFRTHVGDLLLNAGDALLVVGAPERLTQLTAGTGLIAVTPPPAPAVRPRAGQRRIAIAIAAVVLGLSAAQQMPTAIAVLLGMVLFVLSGCLTMDEALAAIEWKTVFVIAGMLPLSTAMQKTGLAATIGEGLVGIIGGYGTAVLAGGLYAGTLLLAQVLGGQVTALVMGPVAIAAAASTGESARAIGIVVALGCSASFLTPLAHPVNLLMAAPGGYGFRDYFRVGLGLTIVCFVIVVLAVPWLPGG